MPIKSRYRKNPKKWIAETKEYCRRHPIKTKRRQRNYRIKNRKKLRKAGRDYFQRPYVKRRQRRYYQRKYHTDKKHRKRVLISSVKRTKKVKRLAQKLVKKIKEATPCADCKRFFPYMCMDFDHVRGNKYRNVAQLQGGWASIKRLQEEIAKCEVVCACCHRVRTWKRQNL